jgi:hypothetical protein
MAASTSLRGRSAFFFFCFKTRSVHTNSENVAYIFRQVSTPRIVIGSGQLAAFVTQSPNRLIRNDGMSAV